MTLAMQLALKNSLKITNNLRQAIDLMSLNADDLERWLQEEMCKNPFLLRKNQADFSKFSQFEVALAQKEALKDFRQHIYEQACLSFNKIEKEIAYELIYNLNDEGFLEDKKNICEGIFQKHGYYYSWIESVRQRIMDLDPTGCGCESIEELIKFRLNQSNISSKAKHKIEKIEINQKTSIQLKKKYPKIIKQININPSFGFKTNHENYHLSPDLILNKLPTGFFITTKHNFSLSLAVENNTSMKKNQELGYLFSRAQFILKAIKYRELNLLKVAQAIVEYQKPWFFQNLNLIPMKLEDISQKTGLHLSSVSRLVNDKYLLTAQGLIELKTLFSQAISQNQPSCSSLEAKEKIKWLIKNESKEKPLSDLKLSQKLKDYQIIISRRTVSKYREALGFLAANQRKILGSTI